MDTDTDMAMVQEKATTTKSCSFGTSCTSLHHSTYSSALLGSLGLPLRVSAQPAPNL